MKRKMISFILSALFFITLVSPVSMVSADPGRIYTTDSNHVRQDQNPYDSRQAVYLDMSEMPKDKEYHVIVTSPNDELLGQNVGFVKLPDNYYSLWDLVGGYSLTPNDGGEYKVSVIWKDGDKEEKKSDNFKVKTAAIDIQKTASTAKAIVGDTIVYTYVVKNIGNVALSGFTVEDNKLDTIGTGINLQPGDSTTLTKDHVAVLSDPDTLINVATVSGTFNGTEVKDTDDAQVSIIKPSLIVTKVPSTTVAITGTVITYSYTVQNDGNVALEVSLRDDKLDAIELYKGATKVTSLAPGETATGSATYTVKDSDKGSIANIATATGVYRGEPRDVTVTKTATATVTITEVVKRPSIQVYKSADKDEARVGDKITYTYKVINNGDTTLTGVTAVDAPRGTVSLTLDPLPGLTLASETVTSLTLTPGRSATGTIEYTVQGSDNKVDGTVDKLENTVTATGRYGESTSDTVSATASESVDIISPAINVTKTADPYSVVRGGKVTYTYTVKNTGDVALSNVALTDDKLGDIALNLSDGKLAPQESKQVFVDYTTKSGDPSPLTNKATTTGKRGSYEVKDDVECTIYITDGEEGPVFRTSKTDGVTTAKRGDILTYEITITGTYYRPQLYAVSENSIERDPAYDGPYLLVIETPDTNTEFRNCNPLTGGAPSGVNQWTEQTIGGKQVCTYNLPLEELQRSEGSVKLYFKAEVKGSTPSSVNSITNEVKVRYDGTDYLPAYDTDSLYIPYNPPVNPGSPNLVISKTDNDKTAKRGDEVEYTITVENKGTAAATGVKVTDTLPAGTEFVASKSSAWTLESGKYVFSVGTLYVGGKQELKFTLKVLDTFPADKTEVLNVAEVRDDSQSTKTAQDTTPVTPPTKPEDPVPPGIPDLTIAKTDNDVTAKPGDEVEYFITVENAGNGDAKNVKVIENLPDGTEFLADSNEGWSLVEGKYIYALGDVKAGEKKELKFVVKVKEVLSDDLTELANAVEVMDNGADQSPYNNTAVDNTPLDKPEKPKPDLPKTGGVAPEMVVGGFGLLCLVSGTVLNFRRKKQ